MADIPFNNFPEPEVGYSVSVEPDDGDTIYGYIHDWDSADVKVGPEKSSYSGAGWFDRDQVKVLDTEENKNLWNEKHGERECTENT